MSYVMLLYTIFTDRRAYTDTLCLCHDGDRRVIIPNVFFFIPKGLKGYYYSEMFFSKGYYSKDFYPEGSLFQILE